MEKHPLHIKTPELQKSDEVQGSVNKKERLTNESLPNDPTDRIEAYMERLEKIFLNPDERVRKRNIEMLRPHIYEEFVIGKEDVPESYFELQQRVARERGQEVEEIPQEAREQMIDTVIEDQKHSLDQWVDYLTSDDAMYPTWFKYFVFSNITKLSQFDKNLGRFKNRVFAKRDEETGELLNKPTTAPFPDIYREPLAQIADFYEEIIKDQEKLKDPEIQKEFAKSFPKIYAEKITEALASKQESSEEVKGEWIEYKQNNSEEAQRLYDSLQGKGTGWCTAGKSTAEMQIKSGNFWVFYTYVAEQLDEKGNPKPGEKPKQPRLAIRMNGTDKIGEVRGVLEHQEVEPILQEELATKLEEFGNEADIYKKKTADMRHLTEIDNKVKEDTNTKLTKSDLTFLYEINSKIEGFGYQKDPRIEQLRQNRNAEEDAMWILSDSETEPLSKEKLATNPDEITEETVVYIGPITENFFNKIPDTLEHIYTDFPEGKINRIPVKVGSSGAISESDIEAQGFKTTGWSKDILGRMTTEDWQEQLPEGDYELVVVPVSAMEHLMQDKWQGHLKRQDIYDFETDEDDNPIRDAGGQLILKEDCFVKKAGLLPVPRKLFPQNTSTLQENLSQGEWFMASMDPITDSGGNPCVFFMDHGVHGGWLRAPHGHRGSEWDGHRRFAFLRRKS